MELIINSLSVDFLSFAHASLPARGTITSCANDRLSRGHLSHDVCVMVARSMLALSKNVWTKSIDREWEFDGKLGLF